MLSVRSAPARVPTCAARRSSAASRRPLAPVRAGDAGKGGNSMLNNIASAFVSIFSPPKDDAPNGNWSGTTSPFSGKISHHGPGKPFKDGFSAVKAAAMDAGDAAAGTAEDAADAAQGAGNEAMGYVSDAVKGVMDKNFPGKADEERPTTASEGWKGDIHSRKKDGFHAPRS